jgi:hypothetical protein
MAGAQTLPNGMIFIAKWHTAQHFPNAPPRSPFPNAPPRIERSERSRARNGHCARTGVRASIR